MNIPEIATSGVPLFEDLSKYDLVINVTDYPHHLFKSPVPYYWFPIHEQNFWGYNAFYGAKKVIEAHPEAKAILIHCTSGVCRSVSLKEALLAHWGILPGEASMLLLQIKKGVCPHDTVEFLDAMDVHPIYSIHGILQAIESPHAYRQPIITHRHD